MSYSLPTMAEVNATPWNGYEVVSTFSGGGGSCLGYRMAGYHVIWANEFVPAAQEVYRANHPDTILNTRDIRSLTPEDILAECGRARGDIDLLDGSPPCASFSTAGLREKSWGKRKSYSDTEQRVDDLFFEYARILEGLQPKTFVAENVSGLVKGSAKGYFKWILGRLRGCGYEVKAQLLNAQWLGVPQSRERLIFVGVRNDLVERYDVHPTHPRPFGPPITIREAFEGLHRDLEEERAMVEETARHKAGQVMALMPKDPPRRISGEEVMGQGKWFSLVRQSMDLPCSTIQQSHGNMNMAINFHPTQDRGFTIGELKRITSLPDDFVLTGDYEKQYERCGRMVPPVMMSHIAKTIQTEILDHVE